ncbi:hypothetical protein EW146_g9797 [Bondarzewia mesenterica]|uniref:AB hydrolase-1 domain-containing protein n=1 Tax=Bondarzewia mesenterica TaxID=1095465 RepID=A0A4S4L3D6_9AGAM|nr:hypothetical protein EW146_g9797 [Bondarzewia mesenterica]
MPFIDIKSTAGPLHLYYTISTPTNPHADSIDASLPTVIFLHPVYISQQIFHLQFSDPILRRFNLVALDSRLHGESTGPVPKSFDLAAAAEDLFQFMEALNLPPCHLVGLSMGACIALQLAIDYPEKALSVVKLSPSSWEEPEAVLLGRIEIYKYWAAAFSDPNHVDQDLLTDAIYGFFHHIFRGSSSHPPSLNSLVATAAPQAIHQWGRDALEELHTVVIDFFAKRKQFPPETLARIRCPVLLVHCGNDIAYPVEQAEEVQEALREAGVEVVLKSVPDACQYCTVSHPKEINTLLHDWLLSNLKEAPLPIPDVVTSPYKELLGNISGSDSDSSDE